jgi:single-strand DNA-binding protein
VNKVYLIGRVAQAPVFNIVSSGDALLKVRLATHIKDHTEWHNVVVWGELAELGHKFLKKGDKLFVEGRIQTSTWEDDTGTKRSIQDIVASNLEFMTTTKEEKNE